MPSLPKRAVTVAPLPSAMYLKFRSRTRAAASTIAQVERKQQEALANIQKDQTQAQLNQAKAEQIAGEAQAAQRELHHQGGFPGDLSIGDVEQVARDQATASQQGGNADWWVYCHDDAATNQVID